MNLGSFRGGRGKIVAVAEVGSGSVAFAVVEIQKGKPAVVLAADRATLAPEVRGDEATVAGIGDLAVQAGTSALSAYAKDWQKTKGHVEAMYAVIRTPWTRSQAVRAHKEFSEPVRITGRAISALAREALSSVRIDRQRFLEARVMGIELNGYPTARPEGQWAHTVSLTGLVSECDPSLTKAVVSAVGRLVPHVRPVLYSGTRALIEALKKYLPITEYLAIDITAESTTITVVHGGVIEGQGVVPEGSSSILNRLSPTALPEETLSLLRMLEREHCDTEPCDALKSSIGKIEPDLVRLFGETMGKLAGVRRLPNYAVLSVHADMSPWLVRFFSRIDFTQFTQTAQPFIIHDLSPKSVASTLAGAGVELDTGLALACALVNSEETEE